MVTIEGIQSAVAEFFGVSVAELKRNNSTRAVVIPRQIAMYLAAQMTEASLPDIAREFGKHYTTVALSIARIHDLRQSDAGLDHLISNLSKSLAQH